MVVLSKETGLDKEKQIEMRSRFAGVMAYLIARGLSTESLQVQLGLFQETIAQLSAMKDVQIENARGEFKVATNPEPSFKCNIIANDGFGQIAITEGSVCITLGSQDHDTMIAPRYFGLWKIGHDRVTSQILEVFNPSECDLVILEKIFTVIPKLMTA